MASPEGTEPAATIAKAVARHGPSRYEDRLTEAYATALAQHSELARAFARRAGFKLPDDVVFSVRTQKLIGVGRRSTDLELLAWKGDELLLRLWVENKLDSAERPRQLDDQYAALQRAQPAAAKQRLVTIVKGEPQHEEINAWARPSTFDVEPLTWLELSDLIRTIGMDEAGEGSPRTPVAAENRRGSATTERRSVLPELLREIANQSANPMLASEPVTRDDLAALAQINKTIDRLQALLWQAFESDWIGEYRRASPTSPKWRDPAYHPFSLQADVAAPRLSTWIEDDCVNWRRYAAITAATAADHAAVLEVGVWTNDAIDRSDETTHTWKHQLETAGLSVDLPAGQNPNLPTAWVWREQPLLSSPQPSFIAQRDETAASIQHGLAALERDGRPLKPSSPPAPG